MKKLWLFLLLALLLCGCQASPTFETLPDVYGQQQTASQRNVVLELPENVTVIRNDSGRLYLCDGYDVTVEIMVSGDLNRTMQTLTGFASDALTMVRTSTSNLMRYECVWSAAGEGGDQVGRAVVLDDGCYHYCVTVTAASETAGSYAEEWNALLESIRLN